MTRGITRPIRHTTNMSLGKEWEEDETKHSDSYCDLLT